MFLLISQLMERGRLENIQFFNQPLLRKQVCIEMMQLFPDATENFIEFFFREILVLLIAAPVIDSFHFLHAKHVMHQTVFHIQGQ